MSSTERVLRAESGSLGPLPATFISRSCTPSFCATHSGHAWCTDMGQAGRQICETVNGYLVNLGAGTPAAGSNPVARQRSVVELYPPPSVSDLVHCKRVSYILVFPVLSLPEPPRYP